MKRIVGLLGLFFLLSGYTNLFSQVTDVNNQTYKTVKIGKMVWMAENLNVAFYRNGDSIPQARTNEEWQRYGKEKKGCWSYYKYDSSDAVIYGKLYNWYSVTDPMGLAPAGWRVASFEDWDKLIVTLKGKETAGKKMKSTDGWEVNTGTNESGFTAKPGGLIDRISIRKNKSALWWCSSEQAISYQKKNNPVPDRLAWFFELSAVFDKVLSDRGEKSNGFSVRCVKD